MVTHVGFIVLSFSCGVLAVAFLGLIASYRWRWLRAPALRMALVFSVFAIASCFVWLDVGPGADLKIQANEAPRLYVPTFREFDI